MSSRKDLGPQTRAVHSPAPDLRSMSGDPLAVPIVQASSFGFESIEAMEHALANPGTGYMYSRAQNPTVDAMERAIAGLEGAEEAVAFASGMAAIHAAVLGELSAGDHLVAPASMYGGATALFDRLLPRLGIEHSYVDSITPEAFRAAARPTTKVFYCESIGNPLLAVPDLEGMAEAAHAVGARLLVDSTLATPMVTRPLERGADVVIHSASKYFGGHGDLIAGVVAGSSERMRSVRHVMFDSGGCMAPFVAWLISRGLKTLPLRMVQHQRTAQEVAEALEAHPKVRRCHFPGLASHPDHQRAKAVLQGGFGAVIAFEHADGDEAAVRFCNQLELFSRAASLGDTHSLVVMPAMTSHRALSPEGRAKAGISPGCVRLSIGLEDAADLIADLHRALEA